MRICLADALPKPFISARNRKAHLEFAEMYKSWTRQEWARVLWSDERKFNMFSSDGIRYIRRPPNKRDYPKYQVPTVKHGGGHVMVCGCFSRSEVGPLVYVKDILDRLCYCRITFSLMLSATLPETGFSSKITIRNTPLHM